MPYLGKQAVESGALISTYEFVQATDTASGTTSFGAVSGGGDYVLVFLNGVLLVEGASNDYTKTNSAVVLGTAPADGDILKVDVYSSMNVWDTLPASGGSVTGDLTVTGIITGKGILPLGAIIPIASGLTNAYTLPTTGTVDSNGFVLCDGASFHGDCTLTGNAPTLNDGRFLQGNTHANVGGTGAGTKTLSTTEIPAHTHTGAAHTHTGAAHTHGGGSHTHSFSTNSTGSHSHTQYGTSGSYAHSGGFGGHSGSPQTGTAGSHSHSGTTDSGSATTGETTPGAGGSTTPGAGGSTGGGSAFDVIPKYLRVVYLIRAK